MTKFRPAPLALYVQWLQGYLNAGGTPTHFYDYTYAHGGKFLVATASFTTGGECGVYARNILTPEGIEYRGGCLGHNGLFFFDGFVAPTVVPVYCDEVSLALPGVVEFAALQRRRHVAWESARKAEWEASLGAMQESDLGQYILGDR